MLKRYVSWLKKVLLYGFVSLAGLFLLVALGVAVYQDEIIQKVITEVNKTIQTRIAVGKLEVSVWKKFPHLSVYGEHITVQGTLPDRKTPLAKAEKLYLTFRIWDLLGDDFSIDQVFIENADVQLFLDKNGNENYNIVRKDTTRPKQTTPRQVRFDIHRIRLKNVQVRYTDAKIEQDHQVLAHDIDARLSVTNDDYLIFLTGDLLSQFIRVEDQVYFANKSLKIKSEMQYDDLQRKLLIQPSTVQVNQSAFQVMGYHSARPASFVDIQINGQNTDIQTLFSLLPESFSKAYASYESQGEVYFKSSVVGYTTQGHIPRTEVEFGCKNASFYESRLKKRITNAYLTGTFSNGARQNRATSSLILKNVRGMVDGRRFSGELTLKNFDNPYLTFGINGTLDMATVTAFVPYGIRNGSGLLTTQMTFEGNLNQLKSRAARRFIRTTGTVQAQNVGFTLTSRPLRLSKLNGDFAFNQTDLKVNRFSGYAGSSDFSLNGTFENFLPYILLNAQALHIVADFQSRNLNLDELLAENPSQVHNSQEKYRFQLSPLLDFNLTCRVNALQFRRFRATNLQGDLDIHQSVARSRDISLDVAGGNMRLNVGVDARQPALIQVSCNADMSGIQIEKAFYMFEDFGQSFIRSEHVRGQVTARVQTYMAFDEHLESDHSRLVAEIFTTIRDGQLVRFEPMQKLSRFIKQSELANLRFGEMQNNIHIEKRTIFIPLMEITSNVAHISAQGTHTFDNVMDYHLRIPLKTFFQRNAIKTNSPSAAHQPNLFVKINGTAENYKIGYDSQAVREKIRKDLQQSRPGSRQAWSSTPTRPQAQPQAQSLTSPTTEEYFDF